MSITYENLFFEAFNCFPNESKLLEEYSNDELIRLIHILKKGIDTLNNSNDKSVQSSEKFLTNDDYGLGIIAATDEDLQSFQQHCSKYFLPISKSNCYISSQCNQDHIDRYLTTGINHLRSEYAMIILLENVQSNTSLIYDRVFTSNNRLYKYQLKILIQNANESFDELITKIRDNLLSELFFIDRDDHESIPSLPAPKQPQFVSILPYTQIACWPLPGRRDLNRFHDELGITHVLTLLNEKEMSHSNICHKIQSSGMQSLHIPIEGADLSVFTSSQTTIDVLQERLPSIVNILLNSNETQPVKMLIHCAAGLHRTGTITYLLLRLCHFSINQSLLIINQTRAITARQVGKKRIDAVEYHLLEKLSNIE